uniref:Uncharacterized protein n=1 Tax=Glossina pallidipes TaxID=7398 RepID=A0A1A9ZA65_GLOPL
MYIKFIDITDMKDLGMTVFLLLFLSRLYAPFMPTEVAFLYTNIKANLKNIFVTCSDIPPHLAVNIYLNHATLISEKSESLRAEDVIIALSNFNLLIFTEDEVLLELTLTSSFTPGPDGIPSSFYKIIQKSFIELSSQFNSSTMQYWGVSCDFCTEGSFASVVYLPIALLL